MNSLSWEQKQNAKNQIHRINYAQCCQLCLLLRRKTRDRVSSLTEIRSQPGPSPPCGQTNSCDLQSEETDPSQRVRTGHWDGSIWPRGGSRWSTGDWRQSGATCHVLCETSQMHNWRLFSFSTACWTSHILVCLFLVQSPNIYSIYAYTIFLYINDWFL